VLSSYLVKRGQVMDLFTGLCQSRDILVENGVVTAVGEELRANAEEVIDASGLTITPGWVDDHAHMYYDAPDNVGVDPQSYFLPYGVTYAIDPGTAGADNFRDFREYVRWNTDIRYKSYLNISRIGVPIYGYDLSSMDNLDEDACRETFQRYRDELIGLKVRITSVMCPEPLRALQTIRRLCDELETNFCVHATRCDLPADTILSYLHKGDMLTHAFANTSSGILDEEGRVRKSAWEARERGVIFDMGHGINSFTFATARKAMAQGFMLDSISTDLHVSCVNGPVYDMPTTLSKFLALGVSLPEALRLVTVNPVKNLGLTDKALTLEVGQPADFTAFQVQEGQFRYVDSEGTELESSLSLESRFTCLGSKIFTPRRHRQPNRKIGNAALAERDGK